MVWIPEQKIVGHLHAFKKKTAKNSWNYLHSVAAPRTVTLNIKFKFHPTDETVTLYISISVLRSASVGDTHHLNF